MEEIIEKLQFFHFTRIEAQVYLCLLKNSQQNGSQIAKYINIPRTSVYMALETMYQKGIVYKLPGERNIFSAQDPKLLLEVIKKQYDSNFSGLEEKLSSFEAFGKEDQYWNINGYDNFIRKTKEMILSAQREIVISTNHELHPFYEELTEAGKNNVKIVIFSFENLDLDRLPVHFFHNPKKVCDTNEARMLLSVDKQKVFIASGIKGGEFLGTFTENPLLVSIVTEHIGHDIYLLKLEQEKQKDAEQ